MVKTRLEEQVEELHKQLDALTERVRLTATAERFIAGTHEIRGGDCIRLDDGHATNVYSINDHDGKWTYRDRRGHHVEAFRVPPEDGIERLYTIPEVAEIVARVGIESVHKTAQERESIDAFTRVTADEARDRSTDVGTLCVIMAAARAAADMAPRDVDGYIDTDLARTMLARAHAALGRALSRKG